MAERNNGWMHLKIDKPPIAQTKLFTKKQKKLKKEPFVIERSFQAPVEKVWQAITDKEQMKQWYFDVPAFKPEVGTEFSFTGTGSDGTKYVHLCKVAEVVPQKKLSYTWQYKDMEGASHLTFELISEGEATTLKLTHNGLETFPQDKADFSRESFAKGWTEIIGTSLPNFLNRVTA